MDRDELQKFIPNTDGKQTVGHSYPTTSKAMRTSHSNDESSGKSVEIKKNDSTPDSDPMIDANTADECTPAEIALRNELVLESLFRYVNRSNLLSCRVVNKQWQYEATKELRRRKLVLKFSFWRCGNQMSRSIAFQDVLSKCRTPSLLSSFEVKVDARNYLESVGVENIFTTVGNQLKHLTLYLNYFDKRSSLKSSSLKNHLHNLLYHQAPSLEFLEIELNFRDHWVDELHALDSSDHDRNDKIDFLLLPNLKTFIVNGTPPPKFFADVICAATNLRYVGVSSSIKWETTRKTDGVHFISLGGLPSACIKYFLGSEGKDKIPLLKILRVYLISFHVLENENDELSIELIESFLTEHKQNLQLEILECVSRWENLYGLFEQDVSFFPRIVNAINQILEFSSGSLLKLRIEPAKWFNGLLIIPRLPKLKEICFDCVRRGSFGFGNVGGFFPRGFNMNKSFPNISSIVLFGRAYRLFRQFVIRMDITLIDTEKNSYIDPLFETVTDFRHVFPNLVSISCVDENKYYEI